MLDELELHLSTTTNRLGRPYQQGTIRAYMTGARTLDRWMTLAGVEHDFTSCDAATLNQFFRHHYETHDVPKSQDGKGGYTGGTSTLQRNCRVLFAWLEEEYEVPNPWRDKKLHRYASPPQGKPKTLSSEFVTDCLRVTGNGNPRVRDFETTRDHAIIRVLTEGLRAEELLNLRVQDLDLHGHTLVVVPLKGDRNSTDGRTIPLQPKTVRALQRYLRAREGHNLSQGPWLWLGTRTRNRLRYSGLYRLTKRIAELAGYDPTEVSPHSYCHTWADDLLSNGVSGENVMAVRGWKSAAMLKRYAHDQASQRAVTAVHQLGDRY
ncbi:tyrosine-type recombinase/integrase [Streptomyces cyaneofuscatus]|uniref:tyrosine-type recombinase/integrase n=1 Tax=Streptomyces cyaneofuscatus TaxID=66883 RepID=UPI0036A7F93B